jgi:hypothetical protein
VQTSNFSASSEANRKRHSQAPGVGKRSKAGEGNFCQMKGGCQYSLHSEKPGGRPTPKSGGRCGFGRPLVMKKPDDINFQALVIRALGHIAR